MNTEQLYDVIWSDRIVSSHLMAIVPCNTLKYIREPQGCYIVNINRNSYLRGDVGHWIFLRIHDSIDGKINTCEGAGGDGAGANRVDSLVDSRVDRRVDSRVDRWTDLTVELFDSLGAGIYNEDIKEFIKRFSNCNNNKQRISSAKCGFYVLVYAYYSCRNFKPACILNILNVITDIEEHCTLLYRLDKKNKKKG